MRIERRSFPKPWSPKMFEALYRINPKGFYVSESKKKIVGYAVVVTEPVFFKSRFKMRAHLLNLAIDQGHRREGIGTSIIQRIIDDAKETNASEILLEVRTTNSIAQAFYSKLKFLRVGLIRDFYEDGDAIVMSKKIP